MSLLSAFKWGDGCYPYRERVMVVKSMKEDLLPHMTNDHYKQKLLEWLPYLSPQHITVHSFENALGSLLSIRL